MKKIIKDIWFGWLLAAGLLATAALIGYITGTIAQYIYG